MCAGSPIRQTHRNTLKDESDVVLIRVKSATVIVFDVAHKHLVFRSGTREKILARAKPRVPECDEAESYTLKFVNHGVGLELGRRQ